MEEPDKPREESEEEGDARMKEEEEEEEPIKISKVVQPINGRLMYITLSSQNKNIAFINAYAPTAPSTTEKKKTSTITSP